MQLKKIYLISNYTPDGGVNSMFKETYDFFKNQNLELIIYLVIKNNQKFIREKYNFIKNHEIRFFNVNTNIESLKFIKKLNIFDFNFKNDLIFSISGTSLMNLILRDYFKNNILCWIATPYFDEKIALIKNTNILKKFFFYFFEIPICIAYEKYIISSLKEKIISLSNYTNYKFKKITCKTNHILNCPIKVNSELVQIDSSNNNFNIFFSGRLNDPRKNIELFLKVIKSFPLIDYKNINFYLIGGKLNKKLENYIKKNNLQNIHVIEYLDKVSLYKYYSTMNLFLLTSFQEGLCISAIEATYFNIPIISTKCGGISDVLVDNFNGYFVKYDHKDIINKILSLIDDNETYDNFRNNSKKIYDNFNFKLFSNKLESIIYK